MSVLIISDLHIFGPEDPIYRSLLFFIEKRASSGDTIVLAGDLFDLFIGNKSIFKERYKEFFQIVRAISMQNNIEFHYIEGNHDFFMREAFHEMQCVFVHSQEVSLEVLGKKFYCIHGDTVNPLDYGYKFLRFFFRSFFMKCLITIIPGEYFKKIGQFLSQKSRWNKPLLISELPIDQMEKVRRIYRSYAAEKLSQGYDYVIMGHCHDLDEMSFSIGGRLAQYINVGFPRIHGSFLCWDPGDDKIHRERLPSP